MRRLLTTLLLSSLATPALAAESFDGCTGFIDALPTAISTQGTWCLRKDLSTAVASGAAITVNTNNVTIDCNGFKLGGLPAGPASLAWGVYAGNRLNTTVRDCAIRGFHTGIRLSGAEGGGHLVEDNRIGQSLSVGIYIDGDSNLVQRNRVIDTGKVGGGGMAISAEADIRDNTIDGVIGQGPVGIHPGGLGTEVRGNRVRGLAPDPAGFASGIITYGAHQSIVDNRVIGSELGTEGAGIVSSGNGASFCRDNLVANFDTGISMCEDNGGNVVHGAAPP